MELIRTTNPDQVAGTKLTDLLASYQHTPVLLLLSAGSAYALLDHVSPNVLDSRLTVGVLDERYDESEAVNNYAGLRQTRFYRRVVDAGGVWIDTSVRPGETMSAFTKRYQEAISSWLSDNPEGVVLATLGLGFDGHTAGIMPGYVTALDSSNELVVGYEVPTSINPFPKRVTATPYFLTEKITAAVAYIDNRDKCSVLEQVLATGGDREAIPALLWHQVKQVTVVASCPA